MEPQQLVSFFEFTPNQRQMMHQLLDDLTEVLAEWKFNDPANKELHMLQHAAVSGKRQQLKELLAYDTNAQAIANEIAEERKAEQFVQPE